MFKFEEQLILKNQKNIKHYTDGGEIDFYKFTNVKNSINPMVDYEKNYSPKGSVNENKLDNNISRAKSKIREYGYCNMFNYFATLTLDKKKYNRYDLPKFRKDLSQLIKDLRKKHKVKIDYVMVPEKHSDGAWHMHALFNMPNELLKKFDKRKKLTKYILKKYDIVRDCPRFSNKFGYVLFEPIGNKLKTINYILKYITKDLAKCVSELGGHLYYSSKGLNKAETIKKGTSNLPESEIPYTYKNDYINSFEFANDPITILYATSLINK